MFTVKIDQDNMINDLLLKLFDPVCGQAVPLLSAPVDSAPKFPLKNVGAENNVRTNT